MKTVMIVLLLFVFGFINCGPIDDGLLPNNGRRVIDESGSDFEPVDAIVVDANNERERRPFYYPRRRFLGPFFDENEEQDDDYFMNYRPVYHYRPFGFGSAYRPFQDDLFSQIRHQMDHFRRYWNAMHNRTEFDFGGPFDDLPPNYSNSTYTTKVVNGSVISVNETVKKHTSDDSSFIFKVKVFKVRPQNETVTPEEGVNKQEPEATEATKDEPVALPVNTPTPSDDSTTATEQPIPTDDTMDNDVALGRQF